MGRKGKIEIPKGFSEVICDSGGYQLQVNVQSTRTPSVDAYSLWLVTEVLPYYPKIEYFNLDILGDGLKTLENQLIMESYGLKPIPIWHLGEGEEYLNFYYQHYEYISVGGLVAGNSSKKELRMLTSLLTQKYPGRKYHYFGIGITGTSVFQEARPYCLPDCCNKVYHYDSAPTLPSKVRVGDKLIGFDGQKFVPTVVKEAYTRTATELLQITYRRDSVYERQVLDKVTVTLEHPFYTSGKGWIEAKELQEGDELFLYHPIWFRKLRSVQRKPPTLETREKTRQSILRNDELMTYLRSRPSQMHRPEIADKVRQKLKGRKIGDRIPDKKKRREMTRKGWETRNRGPSSFSRRPSSLEVLVIKIAQEYSLPIEYVGNAKLPIGNMTDRRYPDFRVIGRNKVIESFDNRWPPRKDNYQSELLEHYKKYGWDCLMLDVCNKSSGEIANEIALFCSNGAMITKIERITGKTRGRSLSYPFKVYNFCCEPVNNFVLNYVLTHNSVDFSTWSNPARFGNEIAFDPKQLLKEVSLPQEIKDRLRGKDADKKLLYQYLRESIERIKSLEETIETIHDPEHQIIML